MTEDEKEEMAELRRANGNMRHRLDHILNIQSHLEVVLIDEHGYYVNAAVKKEIERLRAYINNSPVINPPKE